ncbi:MAG TPA: RNase adapter RapZ [Gammaproteobacteria bacterium]|nr:RNase adapter RapZ [Gammaproteobacteria bacterium]
MKLLIVSGMSGSGKSVALNVLEDLGYYCLDNLPVSLLPEFAERVLINKQSRVDRAAVGIDARNLTGDLGSFPEIIAKLRERDIECETFFLTADENTLLKRFSETRRRHPLTSQNVTLADAIKREGLLLEPISASADLRIETSHTNVHQLRDLIVKRLQNDHARSMSILFESFGFKNGVPADADFVFDVRCLPNPHWEPSLRPFSGLDRPVIEFLEAEPSVNRMLEQMYHFLHDWIPQFEADNRSYMTIAIGCTGGQHRSVYLAEQLARRFQRIRVNIQVRHRELLS